MSRDPSAERSRSRQRLKIALTLTLIVFVIELLGGLLSHSLALLSDAGHMLTDAAALGMSLFAFWLASRPATFKKTFGYRRAEILAAFFNGIGLWVLVAFIVYEAIRRMAHPPAIEGPLMLGVALFGLLTNGVVASILFRSARVNLNIRGAWLHVLSDILGSIGAVVGGVFVLFMGWNWVDPLVSLIICALILWSSWDLVKESVNVLLEGAPQHIRTDRVAEALRSVRGVIDVHDLHIWTVTSGFDALSAHVEVEDIRQSERTLEDLNRVLEERFGITHTTLQIEKKKPTPLPR